MFLHTFIFVFIAEMADKTQLMIMALTNRFRMKTILFGMVLGVFAISACSVLAGDLIGDIIPMEAVKIGAAFMFIGFGMKSLTKDKDSDSNKKMNYRFPIMSIATTFFIAELGDKTQLATVALAADHMDMHMQVFLGAAMGLIMANIFGIFAGRFIFSHLKEDTVKVLSSFLFFFFGSINIFEVIPFTTPIIILYSFMIITIAYFIHAKANRQTY